MQRFWRGTVFVFFISLVYSYHTGDGQSHCWDHISGERVLCNDIDLDFVGVSESKEILLTHGTEMNLMYILESPIQIDNNTCYYSSLQGCEEGKSACEPVQQNGIITASLTLSADFINGSCFFNNTLTTSRLYPGMWTIIARVTIFVDGQIMDIANGIKITITPAPSPPNILIPAIAGSVAAGLVLFFLILVVPYLCHRFSLVNLDLPDDLLWFFNEKRVREKFKHVKSGRVDYYKYKIKPSDRENEILEYMKNLLDFSGIEIKKAYAVVSPSLVQSFSNYRKLQIQRKVTDEAHFKSDKWTHEDPDGLKAKTMEFFNNKIKKFAWNDNDIAVDNPILPAVHATDADISWKIAETGFAALCTLDAGWYGKGIYFSTSARYIIPYWIKLDVPVIIITLTLPGYPYPVIEHHLGPYSLQGKSLKTGHQSHYIATTINGNPITTATEYCYDEIVFEQQSQLVPMFILYIDNQKSGDLIKEYQFSIQELSSITSNDSFISIDSPHNNK